MINFCDEHEDAVIVWESRWGDRTKKRCPLCEKIEEYETEIKVRDEKITDLEATIDATPV